MPDGLQMLQQKNQYSEFILGATAYGVLRVEETVQHFPVDVELHLRSRRVADSHRL